MTSLGKLLVLGNTFVAVILFGWAVSLYANRVDWFDRTTADDVKIEGQITQLQAEVKRLSDMAKGTQQSFAAAADRAVRTERERDYRGIILAKRLESVNKVDDTVKFLEQVRETGSALIDVRKEGAEVKGLNGEKLKGLGTLKQKFDELTLKTQNTQLNLLKQRAEYGALCDQINVIQEEVFRQKTIAGNLKDEQVFLSDARINWEEQLRILETRKDQLTQRLATLPK